MSRDDTTKAPVISGCSMRTVTSAHTRALITAAARRVRERMYFLGAVIWRARILLVFPCCRRTAGSFAPHTQRPLAAPGQGPTLAVSAAPGRSGCSQLKGLAGSTTGPFVCADVIRTRTAGPEPLGLPTEGRLPPPFPRPTGCAATCLAGWPHASLAALPTRPESFAPVRAPKRLHAARRKRTSRRLEGSRTGRVSRKPCVPPLASWWVPTTWKSARKSPNHLMDC